MPNLTFPVLTEVEEKQNQLQSVRLVTFQNQACRELKTE